MGLNTGGLGSAVQDAVSAGAEVLRDGKSKIKSDLRTVIRDAEDLLRNAGDASREGFGTARSQLEQTLSDARSRLQDAGAGARGKLQDASDVTRARLNRAAYATTDYVSENPLRALLIAASVGAVVAWLLTRGGDYEDRYDAGYDEDFE